MSARTRISNTARRIRKVMRGLSKGGEVPYSVEDGEVEALPVDARMSPDLSRLGHNSHYFLMTDSSHYLKRHVETLQIKSASYGRRRLTIDVQLPVDRRLGQERMRGDGVHEFWIPVTFLAKHPSRSNVDVRDDRGRVVPLLTRDESNEISLAAVLASAKALLRAAPSPFLKALLGELVNCDGMRGEVPLLVIREALAAEGGHPEDKEWRPFLEALRRLTGNYAMWVRFRGRPGERRVIKLHYDVEFDRQGILRQRKATRNYLVVGAKSGAEYNLALEEPGDKNPYSAIRRVAARVASSTGLGAVNVGIESPYIVGSDSYHLQAESPPGVETRDIDLLAKVPKEADKRKWSRDHGAHLYVSRTRLVQESAGVALLTLRIGRRGFMTLAWLSAVLGATILWLFDLTAKQPLDSPEATASVLLFGPTLLAALVVRPGEHPVATKLFSGVRLLVGSNGILVVLAAAVVAGVRPEGWNIEHCWFILAIAASASAAVVSLGWVFSWDVTYKLVKGLRRQLRTGKRYRRLSAGVMWLTLIVLLLGSLNSQLSVVPIEYLLIPLVAFTLTCGFVAAGYVGWPPPSARLAAIADAATGLAALAGVTTLLLHLADDWSWEAPWLVLALVPAAGLLGLWVNNRRWKRRHKAEAKAAEADTGAEAAAADGEDGRLSRLAETPNWLKQTPSGDLVRKQARKKATGIPDLIAPSAYREVERPERRIEEAQAKAMFEALRDAALATSATSPPSLTFEVVERRAKESDQELDYLTSELSGRLPAGAPQDVAQGALVGGREILDPGRRLVHLLDRPGAQSFPRRGELDHLHPAVVRGRLASGQLPLFERVDDAGDVGGIAAQQLRHPPHRLRLLEEAERAEERRRDAQLVGDLDEARRVDEGDEETPGLGGQCTVGIRSALDLASHGARVPQSLITSTFEATKQGKGTC